MYHNLTIFRGSLWSSMLLPHFLTLRCQTTVPDSYTSFTGHIPCAHWVLSCEWHHCTVTVLHYWFRLSVVDFTTYLPFSEHVHAKIILRHHWGPRCINRKQIWRSIYESLGTASMFAYHTYIDFESNQKTGFGNGLQLVTKHLTLSI